MGLAMGTMTMFDVDGEAVEWMVDMVDDLISSCCNPCNYYSTFILIP